MLRCAGAALVQMWVLGWKVKPKAIVSISTVIDRKGQFVQADHACSGLVYFLLKHGRGHSISEAFLPEVGVTVGTLMTSGCTSEK